MNEEFIKSIYETVVEEGVDTYKYLFNNIIIDKKTVDYWKTSIEFYNSVDESKRDAFFGIIKQIIIDTISNLFGIFDGSVTLSNKGCNINVEIDGKYTDNELQDTFLEYVEELRQANN